MTRERGAHQTVERLDIVDRIGPHATAAGDGCEVGVAVAHCVVAAVTVGRLLGRDEAQRGVVEHHHDDRQVETSQCLELGECHPQAAIAGETHDVAIGLDQRRGDRRRERKAHRRQAVRDQQRPRLVDLPERDREQHVSSGVDGGDRRLRRDRTRDPHDVERRQRAGRGWHRGRQLGERGAPEPLTGIVFPGRGQHAGELAGRSRQGQRRRRPPRRADRIRRTSCRRPATIRRARPRRRTPTESGSARPDRIQPR